MVEKSVLQQKNNELVRCFPIAVDCLEFVTHRNKEYGIWVLRRLERRLVGTLCVEDTMDGPRSNIFQNIDDSVAADMEYNDMVIYS